MLVSQSYNFCSDSSAFFGICICLFLLCRRFRFESADTGYEGDQFLILIQKTDSPAVFFFHRTDRNGIPQKG